MRINIEDVEKLNREVAILNQLNFDEVEWYENDKKIELTPEQIRHWNLIGLCNISFVECRFWEEEDDKLYS